MRDIVIFTRQFSTMINAGLPLVQALDILATQSENPALKDVTRQVVFDVESGNTRGRRAAQASAGRSASCTSTWSRRVRRAVFSTRSSCASRCSWKRTTPSSAR